MTDASQKPDRKVAAALFAMIIIVAVVIRLWGIKWGLPDSQHYFSFHPDENLIVSLSVSDFGGVNIFAGQFLTHYYNYGSLPFYENNFFISLASGYHYLGPVLSHGAVNYPNFGKALLIARLLSAAFGVGSVWATFALGKRLFNDWTGLAAASFLAVMPLHAQHSHYATVDVGSAFWQTLSMVYAAKVFGKTKWSVKYSVLAGITAGLCAATKYSGALAMLCLIAALYAKIDGESFPIKSFIKLAGLGIAAFVVAFVVACPGCLLEPQSFLYGVNFESNHVMHQGEDYFKNTGPGWIYIITRNLDAGMGLPLLILALGGIAWGLIKRKPGDGIMAAFALPTYLILGAAQSRYARYEIALLPVLAVWAARLLVELVQENKLTIRPVYAGLGAGILILTAIDTWNLLLPMTMKDNRERAAEWINSIVPQSATIATGTAPWFYSATTDPHFAWFKLEGWRDFPGADIIRYCYDPSKPLDSKSIETCSALVTTVSEFQYFDPLRLKNPDALSYFAALKSRYGAPTIFASHHPLFGNTEIDGLPTQDLPTDMMYPSPTVLVYTVR